MALLFGLGSAVMFACSTLLSSRSIRMIGNNSVIGWIMLTGTIVTIPFLIASGWPEISGKNLLIMGFAGIGNIGGLFFCLRALQIGKVGLVAPIVSTEGALAAFMSALAGERLKAAVIFALIVIIVGVLIAAIAPDPAPIAHEKPAQAVLFSTLCRHPLRHGGPERNYPNRLALTPTSTRRRSACDHPARHLRKTTYL